MRVRIAIELALLSIAAATATAQAGPVGERLSRAELSLGYTYLRSNAPVGGCGCFPLNGGSASFAWTLNSGSFALVGDITAGYADTILNTGYGLTLSTYTAGVRYLPKAGHGERTRTLQPFGEVLLGVARAGDTLAQAPNPAAANARAAFAANVGGGLDQIASSHLAFRLIQADYLLTLMDNSANNHQNNLRLTAGVVLRF